uniref:RRM domain-containing protein n=2 Tax=Chrysotila carterae TaxID=13221 RepID=A0A7S4BLX7_CHRCT
MTKASLQAIFTPYGELESTRVVPTKHAAFVNFTSILSALRAKEAIHNKPPSKLEGAPDDLLTKPMLINFTSAQQNCMRARGGAAAWSGGVQRRHFDSRGRADGRERFHGGKGGFAHGSRRGDPNGAAPSVSRALYFGSLPDDVGLSELAKVVEPYGVVESMRLLRPKSCAFINFHDTNVAQALLAKFTSSEEAAPVVGGKRLTVAFAKARPCSEEQNKRIAEGARRKISVAAAPGTKVEQLLERLGAKAELLSHTVVDPEAAAAAESAAPAEEGKDAVDKLCVQMEFGSLGTALAAKAALLAEGDPSVLSVDFVVEPTCSEEEIQAMLPVATAAAADEAQAEPEATERNDGAEEATAEAAVDGDKPSED